jgi:DNA-binding transcriptional regulator of glucitol operon
LLVFLVAVSISMVLLGRWQWRSGRHTGDITNYSYAFQWWAFTVFAIIMCAKIVRDYLQSDVSNDAAQPVIKPAAGKPSAYVAYVAPQSVTPDDDDPERARFNRYLASLYEASNKGTSP